MARTYRREFGSRRYKDFSPQQLEECLRLVRQKELTQKQASILYRIPRKTIFNKLKEKHVRKVGHPTVFTTEEENAFKKCIIQLSDFNFPITREDLGMIIYDYLTKTGKLTMNDP